jgi:uncharacterized membrane protein
MNAPPSPVPEPDTDPPGLFRKTWYSIRARILGGLLFVLPFAITLWVIYWIYSRLERYVIDPLALIVLRKIEGQESISALPYWFETYAAPLIAIVIALLLLYFLGFLVRSRLRGGADWLFLRVPVVSIVYNGVRNVFQTLDRRRGQQQPQRVVLVPFPHPGLRVPGFVTATCRDIETQKVVLCVWVPTSPMPTVGYVLMVPEEDVAELNWTAEETVQTLLSSGLTAPAEVSYYKAKQVANAIPHA